MKRLLAFSTLVLCLGIATLYPSTSKAIDFELGAGISATVVRISSKESQENKAVISNKTTFVPYFALIGDEYYPLENYDLGVSWQFWGSNYEVYQQEIGEDFKDVDSALSGVYFYALPILYYRWGDKKDETAKNWRISLGLGYGASYVTMKGDVHITKSEDEADAGSKLETLDAKQLYYSAGIFARGEYGKYFFQISTYTPQLAHGDYIYRISNVSWVAGYKFNIDFDLNLF